MTIEEIIALDTSFMERARMLRSHDPTLAGREIARLLGCGQTTVRRAFMSPDDLRLIRNAKSGRQVTRITVERDGALWYACVNGKSWGMGYTNKGGAERAAEWLRWPKREKGMAA